FAGGIGGTPISTRPRMSSMKAAGWNEWCFASMGSMSRIVCSLMPEVWSVAPKAPERWCGPRRRANDPDPDWLAPCGQSVDAERVGLAHRKGGGVRGLVVWPPKEDE